MGKTKEVSIDLDVNQTLLDAGYEKKDIYPQLSKAPAWITKLFEGSSKSGAGGFGTPDFVVRLGPRALIIIEDKVDEGKLSSDPNTLDPTKTPTAKNAKEFAEDGAIKYGQSAIKSVDVVLLAIAGSNLKTTTFMGNKGGLLYRRNEKSILPKSEYLKNLNVIVSPSEGSIRKVAQNIHQWMFDEKIAPADQLLRMLAVASALTALFDKGFRTEVSSYEPEEFPSERTIATKAKTAIRSYFQEQELETDKITYFLNLYTPIWTNADLKKNYAELLYKLVNSPLGVLLNSASNLDMLGFFYEEFLKYDKSASKAGSITLTPPHICELMVSLLNLDPKSSIVLDGAAGSGGFLVAALADMLNKCPLDEETRNRVKEDSLIGVEIDEQMWAICTTNLIIRQDGKNSILKNDFFDIKTADDLGVAPTHAVLNPPYNNCPQKPLEFFAHAAELLEHHGILVGIAPTSTFISDSKKRDEFLETNTLKAVMKMPSDLFGAAGVGTQTQIFVVEAHRPHDYKKDKVYFADWSDDSYIMNKLVRVDKGNRKGETPEKALWPNIRKKWLEDYDNRASSPNSKLIKIGDEWCWEAFAETDYSTLTKEKFEQALLDFSLYTLKRNSEEGNE